MSAPARRRVAVIGGGWAGCAAAVALARRDVAVTLIEQARTLGGRARTVKLDGVRVDNGQHLLLGACSAVLDLVATLHGRDASRSRLQRVPLGLRPFGEARDDAVAFTAKNAPAPLHLALAIAAARGLSWRERAGVVRGFLRLVRHREDHGGAATVAARLAGEPVRTLEEVWGPLCLAALNTPATQACAATFGRVLHAAFSDARSNSDFVVPSVALGELVPEATRALLLESGGEVALGTRVRRVAVETTRVCIATDADDASFDAVVVAVGPHQLAAVEITPDAAVVRQTLDATSQFRYEPITTAYVAYAALALPHALARLDDAPGQWIFDRGQISRDGESLRLASVVLSAGGPHDALDHRALVATIDAQLRRLDPRTQGLRWSRVISERRATYACTPGLRRPRAGRIHDRVYLAGDYTDPTFPATLEAAVRSGNAAAAALIDDTASPMR